MIEFPFGYKRESKMIRVILIPGLILLFMMACGGDSGTNPIPISEQVTGIWFASGEYGEHTLFLAENNRWIDLFTTLVNFPDLDPYTPDPTWWAEEGFDGGTYLIDDGEMVFTYWENNMTERFSFTSEGLSTEGRDDDLITIGNRYYIFEDTLSGAIQDPTPLANITVTVTDTEGYYFFNVFSSSSSTVEQDYYGTMPVTMLLKSMAGSHLEVRIAEAEWIVENTPIPFDGYATLGVHCYFNSRDSIYEIFADDAHGSVTFTSLELNQDGNVVMSGHIDGAILYDSLEFTGESLRIDSEFTDVEFMVE